MPFSKLGKGFASGHFGGCCFLFVAAGQLHRIEMSWDWAEWLRISLLINYCAKNVRLKAMGHIRFRGLTNFVQFFIKILEFISAALNPCPYTVSARQYTLLSHCGSTSYLIRVSFLRL